MVNEDDGGVNGDEDGACLDGGVSWRQTGPLVDLLWMLPIKTSDLDEEDGDNDADDD